MTLPLTKVSYYPLPSKIPLFLDKGNHSLLAKNASPPDQNEKCRP